MSESQLMWTCAIMVTTTLMKFYLWFYCRASTNQIVQAYAKDHYFDVITNIVGLLAVGLAGRFDKCIDPIRAIILALYTTVNWSRTVLENAGPNIFMHNVFPALHILILV
ncbi:Metal tolerance protein 3 [Linum grandiflorum]